MPYVSAKLIKDPITGETDTLIEATDDQDREWWLTEDSQVGDWLEYVAKGGTVEPYVEPTTRPTTAK